MLHKKNFPILSVLAVCLMLTACAKPQDKAPVYVNDTVIDDRWEGYNRAVFKFNDALDRAILEPVARGYRYVTPDFAETGIRNALRNLRSPLDLGNQILQGDAQGALDVLTRALINTTFGIGGFVDLAGDVGIPYEKEDFGQTLAVWGVQHGPYLVVPLFGPATLRDHTGNLVDTYSNPLRLYLFNTDESEIYYAITGTSIIDRRTELLTVLADLKENSIDYYAAIRSLYYQNRDAEIKDHNDDAQSAPVIADFDDNF